MNNEHPKPGPSETTPNNLWDKFKEKQALADQPEWLNKKTNLDSINIFNLPIGWQYLTDLNKTINEMKDDPITPIEITSIRIPPETYPMLPMVASVVANKRNPEIPVTLPTQAEIKTMKPWLSRLEKFIGRFSQNWESKFGGYFEKKGQRIITDTGNRIINIIEKIRMIKHPQQQFINELTGL